MRDYKLGKIYKLTILDDKDLVYYGSTIQSLSVRLAGHKKDYKRYKEGKNKNYLTSFKLFETGKYIMIKLVEDFPCNSKYELEAKERWYIENNDCVNKFLPTRTKKEYIKANADKIKKKSKEYRKKNADKLKEYRKEYYKKNAYKKKEYRKENSDKIKEYSKEWYKANVDKQKAYFKEKVKCEFCGCFVGKYSLRRHQQSKKCKSFQNKSI